MDLYALIGGLKALCDDSTLHDRSTRKQMSSLGHRTVRQLRSNLKSFLPELNQ